MNESGGSNATWCQSEINKEIYLKEKKKHRKENIRVSER